MVPKPVLLPCLKLQLNLLYPRWQTMVSKINRAVKLVNQYELNKYLKTNCALKKKHPRFKKYSQSWLMGCANLAMNVLNVFKILHEKGVK